MAKTKPTPLYENIRGKLYGQTKKGDECRQMILAKHLRGSQTGHNRVYLGNHEKRSTPVTPEEILKRTRFAEVARAVNTRAHDLMKMTQDQAAFIAQKDQPNGKKTMKSYLWSLELAAYDASHNG